MPCKGSRVIGDAPDPNTTTLSTSSDLPVLCDDLRWYMVSHFLTRSMCRACDRRVAFADGRVRMCLVRGQTLCFDCFQKSRWPAV